MPALNLQHRRAHNLLLVSKLLNSRDTASPFTLVLDSLEQSGKPLLKEFIRRANTAKTKVIYVAFETLRKPNGVDVFIPGHALDAAALQQQLTSHLSSLTERHLILIDSLNVLASTPSINLPTYLSSFLTPTTSLLALYHSDISTPLPYTSSTSTTPTPSPYSPPPLTLLKYLSTTILTVHSLTHVLARKAARDRSLIEPLFGLAEEKEGVIQGLGSNDRRGVVFEMEYRRKSGRGVREWFFLPSPASSASAPPTTLHRAAKESIILLEDHPLYRHVPATERVDGAGEAQEGMDVSFNLGLTEKQRRDREGVVLPYLDAQREEGMGEGGRILYDMGVEDDFDEEEDEI